LIGEEWVSAIREGKEGRAAGPMRRLKALSNLKEESPFRERGTENHLGKKVRQEKKKDNEGELSPS